MLKKSVRAPGRGIGVLTQVAPERHVRAKMGAPSGRHVGLGVPHIKTLGGACSGFTERVQEWGGIRFATREAVARHDRPGLGQFGPEKSLEDANREVPRFIGHDPPVVAAGAENLEKLGDAVHPDGAAVSRGLVTSEEAPAKGFVGLRVFGKGPQRTRQKSPAAERNHPTGRLGRGRGTSFLRAEGGESGVEIRGAVDEGPVEIEENEHRIRISRPWGDEAA
jgi:hypothetical protein